MGPLLCWPSWHLSGHLCKKYTRWYLQRIYSTIPIRKVPKFLQLGKNKKRRSKIWKNILRIIFQRAKLKHDKNSTNTMKITNPMKIQRTRLRTCLRCLSHLYTVKQTKRPTYNMILRKFEYFQ